MYRITLSIVLLFFSITASTHPTNKFPLWDEANISILKYYPDYEAEKDRINKLEKDPTMVRKDPKKVIAFTIDQFQLGESILIPRVTNILDSKVAMLQEHPEMKITITGHTCNIDRHPKNLEIGLSRAEEVKNYIVSKGISADRIVTNSKGATQPIVPNTNNENRLKNRRVEVIAYK